MGWKCRVSNLQLNPETKHPDEMQDLFLQGTAEMEKNLVWQCRIPAAHLSARRIPFINRGEPERTFRFTGHYLVPIVTSAPARDSMLRRNLVRSPKFTGSQLHMGPWSGENMIFTEQTWRDGTDIIHSSTAQLITLHTFEHSRAHGTLRKWENQIACTIPADVWQLIWISY